jgi:TonB family protein
MKRIIFALIGLAVFANACGKSLTRSSNKPERTDASLAGPEHTEVSTPKDETPPPQYVPYDQAPRIIRRAYPDDLIVGPMSSPEVTVWVKIWIDKTGKPRKAVIQKSDSVIFDQMAMDAAMQFLFKPALKNGEPVDVWVSIPFHWRKYR